MAAAAADAEAARAREQAAQQQAQQVAVQVRRAKQEAAAAAARKRVAVNAAKLKQAAAIEAKREREWFTPCMIPLGDSDPAIVTIEYVFPHPWHAIVQHYWEKEVPFDPSTYRENPTDPYAIFRYVDQARLFNTPHFASIISKTSSPTASSSSSSSTPYQTVGEWLQSRAGRRHGGKTIEQLEAENFNSELYYVGITLIAVALTVSPLPHYYTVSDGSSGA